MRKSSPRWLLLIAAGLAAFIAVEIWWTVAPEADDVPAPTPRAASPVAASTPAPASPEPGISEAELSGACQAARAAAAPYVQEGFTIREDYWGGTDPSLSGKAIVHKLFKGNQYWFWMASDRADDAVSIHIYDSAGKLAEAEAWQKPGQAAAKLVPKSTGVCYVILALKPPAGEKPGRPRHWAVLYGFK